MHPIRTEFDWPKLRRDLEEILAIIRADHNGAPFDQCANDQALLSIHKNESNDPVPDVASDQNLYELEHAPRPELTKSNKPNDLYDDAIVVLTEFGHASPALLQMWLSIDYSNAMTIMNRFQTEGLISSKGRVRHKAFSLRRSLDQPA